MWRISEYNGWTNWETWHAALMMDNEQVLYNKAREIVEKGGTEHDLANWANEHVLGPANQRAIQDAQEWNDIPEHDRLDHNYEEFKEKHPDSMDLLHGLVGGPDVSDTDPQITEEHLVNWSEIYNHIKDELSENLKWEQDQKDMKARGIDFGAVGGNSNKNAMYDAWMRHHGALSDDEIKAQGGNTWDHPQAEHKLTMWNSLDNIKAGGSQYQFPDGFGQELADKIQQEGGWNERVSDVGHNTAHAIYSSKTDNPHIPTMLQALQEKGYTPEQIAEITKPGQKYVEDGKGGGNWVQLDPSYDKAAPIDKSLDQPGDFTLPETWSRVAWNAAGLENPLKWNPEREQAWERAWHKLYGEPELAHISSWQKLAADIQELADKMADSLVNRPDMQSLKATADKLIRQRLEQAAWINPVAWEDFRKSPSRTEAGQWYSFTPVTPSIGQNLRANIYDALTEAVRLGWNQEDFNSISAPDSDTMPTADQDWFFTLDQNDRDIIQNATYDHEQLGFGFDQAIDRAAEAYSVDREKVKQLYVKWVKLEKEKKSGSIFIHIARGLRSLTVGTPESYKMFPWFVRESKNLSTVNNPNDPSYAIDRIKDLVFAHGPTLKKFQDTNQLPKGFDLNKMDHRAFAEWAPENLVEPHEDQSKILYTFPDGWTMRELNPNHPEDYVFEGTENSNCIRDPQYGYRKKHEVGYSAILSLRDSKNRPKVSLEVVGPKGDNGQGYPEQLRIAQEYANSNTAPDGKQREHLDEWYAHLREGGVTVDKGRHIRQWDYEEGRGGEGRPEALHRPALDETRLHPQGNVDINGLMNLRDYAHAANHPAQFQRQDFVYDDDGDRLLNRDENGDYGYVTLEGRKVNLSYRILPDVAKEIGVEALESETKEDQIQVYKDLYTLHMALAHAVRDKGGTGGWGYRAEDQNDGAEQVVLAQLQEVMDHGREQRSAGIPQFQHDWKNVQSGGFHDSSETSFNVMTREGQTILSNAIMFWQRISKIDRSHLSVPGSERDDWNNNNTYPEAYLPALADQVQMHRPLPQYEELAPGFMYRNDGQMAFMEPTGDGIYPDKEVESPYGEDRNHPYIHDEQRRIPGEVRNVMEHNPNFKQNILAEILYYMRYGAEFTDEEIYQQLQNSGYISISLSGAPEISLREIKPELDAARDYMNTRNVMGKISFPTV